MTILSTNGHRAAQDREHVGTRRVTGRSTLEAPSSESELRRATVVTRQLTRTLPLVPCLVRVVVLSAIALLYIQYRLAIPIRIYMRVSRRGSLDLRPTSLSTLTLEFRASSLSG